MDEIAWPCLARSKSNIFLCKKSMILESKIACKMFNEFYFEGNTICGYDALNVPPNHLVLSPSNEKYVYYVCMYVCM